MPVNESSRGQKPLRTTFWHAAARNKNCWHFFYKILFVFLLSFFLLGSEQLKRPISVCVFLVFSPRNGKNWRLSLKILFSGQSEMEVRLFSVQFFVGCVGLSSEPSLGFSYAWYLNNWTQDWMNDCRALEEGRKQGKGKRRREFMRKLEFVFALLAPRVLGSYFQRVAIEWSIFSTVGINRYGECFRLCNWGNNDNRFGVFKCRFPKAALEDEGFAPSKRRANQTQRMTDVTSFLWGEGALEVLSWTRGQSSIFREWILVIGSLRFVFCWRAIALLEVLRLFFQGFHSLGSVLCQSNWMLFFSLVP